MEHHHFQLIFSEILHLFGNNYCFICLFNFNFMIIFQSFSLKYPPTKAIHAEILSLLLTYHKNLFDIREHEEYLFKECQEVELIFFSDYFNLLFMISFQSM